MTLNRKEQAKISCARKHFESISDEDIRYEVVKDYESLHKMLNN